jgi:hypothetical protein
LAKLALEEHALQQLSVLPIPSKIGRPPKTLLERAIAGSFRADRYGRLLDGELLPATPPFTDRRRRVLWRMLREEQRAYQEATDGGVFSAEKNRAIEARSFSRIVRALHGAELPWWLQDEWVKAQRRTAY